MLFIQIKNINIIPVSNSGFSIIFAVEDKYSFIVGYFWMTPSNKSLTSPIEMSFFCNINVTSWRFFIISLIFLRVFSSEIERVNSSSSGKDSRRREKCSRNSKYRFVIIKSADHLVLHLFFGTKLVCSLNNPNR